MFCSFFLVLKSARDLNSGDEADELGHDDVSLGDISTPTYLLSLLTTEMEQGQNHTDTFEA